MKGLGFKCVSIKKKSIGGCNTIYYNGTNLLDKDLSGR